MAKQVASEVVAAMADLASAAANLVDTLRKTGTPIPEDLFETFAACCEVGLDHQLTPEDAAEILS